MAWRGLNETEAAEHPLAGLGGWLLATAIAFGFAALSVAALEAAAFMVPEDSHAQAFAPGHEERIAAAAALVSALLLCTRNRRAPLGVMLALWTAFLAILALQGLTFYARVFVLGADEEAADWALMLSALGWLSRHGVVCALLIGFSVALNGARRPNARYRRRVWIDLDFADPIR